LSHGTLEIASLDATVGPMRIKASGRVSDVFLQAPRVALEGVARLERSQVKGRLEVVVAAAQPTASFDAGSPLLDVDEIMAAVALFAGNTEAPRAAFRLVPPANAGETVAASGPSFVRVLEASGTMRAEKCVAHGLEMTNLSMRVSLVRGLAELRDIRFALYGGKAQGSLTVRPFEPRIPFSLDQAAEGIAIRPLIAALAPAQAKTVEGKASLAVRLSGDAGGATILPSMNGAGSVAIADGKIASFGVIKQVLQALEIAGAKGLAKDETPFDHLSAHFDLVRGTAGTKDLEFRSQDFNGDGTGTVGLGGAVKLDVLASFSKAVSDDLVAKTHALSIRQGADGRLSVPLQIRGTIQDPHIQLDLDKVINEGVLKELKKKGTKSLLKKLLGR
jgi:AsmA protein